MLAATHDLVVAADGANSATRARYASTFCPNLEKRRCRYVWLGTDLVLNAFKFYVLDTPAGIMQVHGYPYADRIRNEIGTKYGVAVIAVGAISSYDDVNSIILAGRADLCALGRTHLYDPQWTLHAAAEQDTPARVRCGPISSRPGAAGPPPGGPTGPGRGWSWSGPARAKPRTRAGSRPRDGKHGIRATREPPRSSARSSPAIFTASAEIHGLAEVRRLLCAK